MQSTAKMIASAAASATHAYHASLTSQDSSGTNNARPNTSPQPNDARRLRPVSASTSSAGPAPAGAAGRAPPGGRSRTTPTPPAADRSRAQRVANPPNAPGPRVFAPAAG